VCDWDSIIPIAIITVTVGLVAGVMLGLVFVKITRGSDSTNQESEEYKEGYVNGYTDAERGLAPTWTSKDIERY